MFNYMTPLEGVDVVDQVEIEAEGKLSPIQTHKHKRSLSHIYLLSLTSSLLSPLSLSLISSLSSLLSLLSLPLSLSPSSLYPSVLSALLTLLSSSLPLFSSSFALSPLLFPSFPRFRKRDLWE